MSIETVLEVQKVFLESGIHSESSQLIVSHLSHNSGFMHDQLVEIFKPYHIEVATDGLVKFI